VVTVTRIMELSSLRTKERVPTETSTDTTEYVKYVVFGSVPLETRVLDICSETQDLISEAGGFLASPGYPDVYPPNQDCICRMVADKEEARLTLVFYDLLLETKKGRCRADWIMLRQNGQFLHAY